MPDHTIARMKGAQAAAAAGSAVVVVLAAPLAISDAAEAASPTGDRAGLALLTRVNHAYANVPGAALSGTTGLLAYRYTFVLHRGRIAAEQLIEDDPNGAVRIVSRGSTTLTLDSSRHCWRPLFGQGQRFADIGLQFPDEGQMRVGAPRRLAGGWRLPIVVAGSPESLEIDGRSMLLRSWTITHSGTRVVERASILSTSPRLLSPTPRC